MPTVFVTGPQGDVSPGVSPVGIFGSSGKSDWAAFPQLFGLAKVNPVEWHRKPQISIEICRWRNDLNGVSAAEMKFTIDIVLLKRVPIIGAGRMGFWHGRAACRLGVKIIWVADPTAEIGRSSLSGIPGRIPNMVSV